MHYLVFTYEKYSWESAQILKSIVTNFKPIDNRLKSVEVIRPIKSFDDQKGFLSLTLFAVACLKNMSSDIVSIIDITDLQSRIFDID